MNYIMKAEVPIIVFAGIECNNEYAVQLSSGPLNCCTIVQVYLDGSNCDINEWLVTVIHWVHFKS